MDASLRRVCEQDRRMSRMLGVDFVPLGAGPAAVEAAATGSEPSQPAPEQAPRPAAVVEAKPAESKPPARAASASSGGDHESRRAALEALRERYEADCPHQHFKTDHSCIVFGDGSPSARLMFVGEAPGAEEDKQGVPFVGRAGQLLNKMIVAMGLSREEVYIANVLKTRPPGNATPTLEEARLCAPYLYGQIGIIRPEAIVTLGLPATRLLLETNEPMARLRSRWRMFTVPGGLDAGVVPESAAGFEVPVMPTYHPAYLLRSYTRENREKVWSDLQQVMDRLGLASAPDGGSGGRGA